MRANKGHVGIIFFLMAAGIFLYCFSWPVSAAIPPHERAALVALYNSTDGDNWSENDGWKTPPLHVDGFALPGTEDTWYGIDCDFGNTTVHSIKLRHKNLVGTIPPELGNLENLLELNLCSNHLSGSIPPELGNMANLKYLYLSSNQLSGGIPPELGNMINLESLSLYGNQLSGSIPLELGNIANLCSLDLDSNQLSGSIPPELGNLTNLKDLDLRSNQLSGSIPPELGNLEQLGLLDISSNQLNGSIPPELGNLANLWYLDLTWNQLSGSIPPELGNLERLWCLYLSGNRLSGSIPPELGNMANLWYLDLSLNQLSGSIPPELGNLEQLGVLDLSSNQLSGGIPPELANLEYLLGLYLSSNRLSDGIPPELANLEYLLELNLSSNQLSGNIPPELGNLEKLYELNLSSNRLSGNIPLELGNPERLEDLYLSGNRLSGSIPSSLTNLMNLRSGNLDLRWNALYTNDDNLRAFLNSKQDGGDWESTQTIAPLDVTAAPDSISSIDISWTPIIYTSDTGGYRVYYSNTSGGPYTYYNMTADKTNSFLTVTGLNPCTTYYFVVQTRTDPHTNNQNTVDSEYSIEVSAETLPDIFTISGTISSGGNGLQGVTVTLSNGGGTAITNANGSYIITVDCGWTGTAVPSKTGYNFSPANRNYDYVRADQPGQDYTAALQALTISGTITSGGNGLHGVTVTLSNGGGIAVTDANGNYSVNVNYGWTGTAVPSKTGYNFSPAKRNYDNVTADQPHQDYTTVLKALTISGTITSSGKGLAGVTITLSNDGGTAVTDANGNYSVNVDYGWTGTAVPSKTGNNFSPAKRSYSNVTTDQPHQDYTAALQALTISGTITNGGNGLPGVTVTLSNGGGTVVTDANGNYSVTVNYGWTGTAVPSKTGYNFSPANRNYNNVTTDQPRQDYTAVLQGFVVSGNVTCNGKGLPGVTMTLSNHGGTVITGSNGKYRITVDYGWTGTAAPSKIGYTFSPAGRTYHNITADQHDQDYTAQLQTFTISGTVTYADKGLPGVTIALSNNGGSVVTGIDGNYSVIVNYGWTGVVIPTKDNYLFYPDSRNYAPVTVNINSQDYSASIPLSLTLRVDRQNEGAFLIKKDFGVITLTVENGWSIPGISFVIYRKTAAAGYQPIHELTASELQNGIYIYHDKYLDKNTTYTYRVIAYDAGGHIIVVSNEENI